MDDINTLKVAICFIFVVHKISYFKFGAPDQSQQKKKNKIQDTFLNFLFLQRPRGFCTIVQCSVDVLASKSAGGAVIGLIGAATAARPKVWKGEASGAAAAGREEERSPQRMSDGSAGLRAGRCQVSAWQRIDTG